MILLDTCAVLWLAADPSQLSPRARDLVVRHAGSLFVSAISAFEIALKHRKGRLRLPLAPEKWFETALEHHGLSALPVDWRVAARSALIPIDHGDPCDRMILATAELQGLTILSPDKDLKAYRKVLVEW